MAIEGVGYYGRLISLSGYIAPPGRDREVTVSNWVNPPTGTCVLGANSRRIAARFFNYDPGLIGLGFGDTSHVEYLGQRESFQIDSNFPWCGAVYATSVGATILYVIEICAP